jgi:hypothetical protein
MSYIFKRFTVVLLIWSALNPLAAQPDSIPDISALIYLDSFVVTASKAGFDKNDFIDMVRTDESFLEAFHNLRFISYRSENQFQFYNKRGKEKASYKDTIQQTATGNCRSMVYSTVEYEGDYFKKAKTRKYNYYTSTMHDRLFYTHQETCESIRTDLKRSNSTRIEKYVYELKKLIFRPGEKADIPFIGNKTSIFTEPMIQYYDFKISNALFNEEVDCYVFAAHVKPEFSNKNKVIINHLRTYFDKSNFQVVGRDLQLAYSAGLYEFDLTIHIALDIIENKYYPSHITCDGFWNISLKKKEAVKFNLSFFDFKTPTS